MAEKIQIQIDAETRQAIANLAKLQTATDEVTKSTNKLTLAQSAWKTLNTDVTKLGGAFGEFSRNVATGVAAGVAGFAALSFKATELAAAIEQQEMAINRLGPAYDAVRAATNGVVSAQEALKAQQTLVQAGIRVSTEQLATITRAAREYARATGTETTQALEQLTDALREGSAEGLGRFGVSLQQGVTGTRAFGSALEQLTAQQQGTAASARTMREDLDKLPEGLTALGRAALSAVEGPLDSLMRALTGVVGASTGLRGVLRELGEAGDTLRQRDRQQATDAAGQARLAAREQLIARARMGGVAISQTETRGFTPEQMSRVQAEIDRVSGMTGLQGSAAVLAGAQRSGALGAAQRLQRQAFVDAVVAQIREDVDRGELRAVQTPAQRAPSARAAARAPGSDAELQSAKQALAQALNDAARQGVEIVQGTGPRGLEDTASYFLRLAAEQRELIAMQTGERAKAEVAFAESRRGLETPAEQAARQRSKAEAGFEMIRGAQQREREASFGGRFSAALGIELDERGQVPALDIAQAGVDTLATSLASLTSGFGELFNTLASGSLSAGEAFQQFAAKTLSSLGQMAVNKGVFYTFEGIASLFTNPVAAPLYFAAGAGLIALGAGLGAAGSAVAPRAPAGGSAAPSAARSASGASPRDAGGGAGNVTIVLSSLVPPGPRELQGLVAAQRQAGRYGLDNARMVPRQVRA